MQVSFFRRTPTATLPTRGSNEAAGLDLYADRDAYIPGFATRSLPIALLSLAGASILSGGYIAAVAILLFSYILYRYMAEPTVISTGISCAIPKGYYGQIFGRSGLAVRGITVGGGVIDSDYRGDIAVILYSNGFNDFKVTRGMRIAQMIILPYAHTNIHEVPTVTQLGETVRGEAGLGSTGN